MVVGEQYVRKIPNRTIGKDSMERTLNWMWRDLGHLCTVRQRCIDWFILRAFYITARFSLYIFSVLLTKYTSTDVQEGTRLMSGVMRNGLMPGCSRSSFARKARRQWQEEQETSQLYSHASKVSRLSVGFEMLDSLQICLKDIRPPQLMQCAIWSSIRNLFRALGTRTSSNLSITVRLRSSIFSQSWRLRPV